MWIMMITMMTTLCKNICLLERLDTPEGAATHQLIECDIHLWSLARAYGCVQ